GRKLFDAAYVPRVRVWPEVELAVPRSQAPLVLKNLRSGVGPETIVGYGVDPETEYVIRPPVMKEGEEVRADGQITLDTLAATALQAQVGDDLEVQRFGDPIR